MQEMTDFKLPRVNDLWSGIMKKFWPACDTYMKRNSGGEGTESRARYTSY